MTVEAPELAQPDVVGMVTSEQAYMLGGLTREEVARLSERPEIADLGMLAVSEVLGGATPGENRYALVVDKDENGADVPAGYVSLAKGDFGTKLNPRFNPRVFEQHGLETPSVAYERLMAAKEAAAKQANEQDSIKQKPGIETARIDVPTEARSEELAVEATDVTQEASEANAAADPSEEQTAVVETPEGQAAMEAANAALEQAQSYIEAANNNSRSDLAKFDGMQGRVTDYMNQINQLQQWHPSVEEVNQLSVQLREFALDVAHQLKTYMTRDSDHQPMAQVEVGAMGDSDLHHTVTQDLSELQEVVAPLGAYDERYSVAFTLTDHLLQTVDGHYTTLDDVWRDLQGLMIPLHDLMNASQADLARTNQAQEIIDRIKGRLSSK